MGNLRKIRIGTDIITMLSVNISGNPVTWSDTDIRHVFAFSDVQGQPVAEMAFRSEGKSLRCTYAAKDQNYIGAFRIIIEFADGTSFASSLDVPAFEIVRTTEEADAEVGEVVLDIDGTMRFYSLSEAIVKIEAATKAANDAAEKANAAAQAAGATNTGIAKAEEQRVNAENARKEAELARSEAERARASAEDKRAESEAKRAEAETQRAAGEQSRVTAETGRVNAESARVKTESERANAEATRAANEEQRKKNERARTSAEDGRAEAEKRRVTAESARVAEFARLKTESETATKNATDAAEEAKEVSSSVAALERDLGQYAELPSVAMTAETTGKYINADGEFVDDADFNIAAIGAVVVGNTYELYMSSADKMKLGVALFVARIKTTTTSGTERIEYVPLFSAMSTDIPTSGYVCFEAMEAYSDVLVCYRADVPEAATLRVRRYGTKASIATQINNLRKTMDLKSFADGYYESMRVGSADNLTSKGDATEEVIMSRKAGGDNQIEDGSASIKRIKGYSVVMNQLCKDKIQPVTIHGVIISCENDLWSFNGSSTGYPYYGLSNAVLNEGHKYMLLEKRIKVKEVLSYREINTNNRSETKDIQPNSVFSPLKNSNSIEVAMSPNREYDELRELKFFDLTTMFGSGNEPTTPDDFAKRLGYSSIDDVPYIPYNEGEIVSSFAEGIKTTDTEGKVSERKWSKTLKKYFPDGLKSAGSAFDEITPTKAVRRLRHMRLTGAATEDWRIESTNSYGINNFYIIHPDLSGRDDKIGFICDKFNKQKTLIADTTSEGYFLTKYHICYFRIKASKVATVQELRTWLGNNPIEICYELNTPEETAYDELNLTEQVAEGGTEEAIITDGKTSTPLRADIVYPIDAYNTIKANKTNIGTLSSLNTASKTDLVSAINELAGKVGALEAKATESVNNETTE